MRGRWHVSRHGVKRTSEVQTVRLPPCLIGPYADGMHTLVDGRRERMALTGLSLAMLMSSLDTSIANASLPALATAFGASFQQAQWIVLAYLLAVTSLSVGAGRLGDLLGRRVLLLAGVALFTLASVACAMAPTLLMLVLGRAVQGAFAATMTALAVAAIGDILPRTSTGGAMGRLAAMSAVGTTVGPAIGGLMHGVAPTAIFLINVPLGVAALVLLRRSLPVRARRAGPLTGFDAPGTALLVVTLLAYALSMTLGRGRWSAQNLLLLALAVVGAVVVVIVERRARSPLVSIAMFRDRTLSVSVAANAAVATVMMSTLIVGPFYLSRGLALDVMHVGVVLSLGPAAAALTAAVAGRMVGQFGERATSIGGLLALASGALALSLLARSAGVAGYVGPLVTMTSGYAAFQTANNTGVMARVDDERRGVVAGLLGLSRNLGLITGAAVMGAWFLHASGASDLTLAGPDAIASGMRATFAVAAGLTTAVLVVTFINPKGK